MAGKGDKWRKSTDLQRYRTNFDLIFRPKKPEPYQTLTDEEQREFEENRASMSYSEFQKFQNR